ncbi:MAG TPA: hypothetical protein VHG91_21950, partial [Longimicrobium sp.]|nr:hypothetical protein [Longimicrobium sp.]
MSSLVVVARSDSFSALWGQLAAEVRAEPRVVERADEAAGAADAVAVLLSVAGVEEEAETALRAMAAAGAPPPVVVGARADHRLAAALVRAGAADYFALPADLEALRAELAARAQREEARAAGGRHAAAERAAFDFGRIVGESSLLRAALNRAAKVIPH